VKKIKKDIRGEKKEKLPLMKGYTAKDDIKAVMETSGVGPLEMCNF
jgi:hypothetical protein